MFEVDALFSAGAREHVETYHGDDDTDPLPKVQSLRKEGQGTNEHHHRTGGIDGAYDGDGQVLQAEVGEEPAGEHDARFQQDVFMLCPTVLVGVEKAVLANVSLCRQDDEGQEYQR